MADTVVNQERTALHVDGVPMFRITAVCTDAGDLPDTGLFLYQIVDPDDGGLDVFTRIVEIADFSSTDGYSNNRTTAVLAGDTYWRSYVLTKDYDSVTVADAAVTALFDRINQLVNDYHTYNTDFETAPGGEDTNFPTSDPTELEARVTTYNTAYTTYETALTDKDTASTALTDAQTALATETANLAEWQDILAHAQERRTEMYAASLGLSNFVSDATGNANGFISYIDGFIATYYVKFGASTRQVEFSAGGYTPAVTSDLGLAVTQATTGDSGTLLAYDNTTRTWWIKPDDSGDTFSTTNTVTVTAGTGEGDPSASVLVGNGPMDGEVLNLQANRNVFAGARDTAALAATAALAGVTNHDGDITLIQSRVTAHTSTVTTAQDEVTTKQSEYNQAVGAVDAAYIALGAAYDSVKELSPSWVPDQPFPPTP